MIGNTSIPLWLALCMAIAFLGSWIVLIEPRWYRIRRISISHKKISRPFTILHISDVHFRKKEGSKKHFFQRLSMLNPDLLVLTGDIIEDSEGIGTAIKLISGIRPRFGAFMVLGNHEYYDYHIFDIVKYYLGLGNVARTRNDVPRFIKELKTIGVRVLVNESVHMDIHGNRVWIGGTDDPVTQKVDFNKFLDDAKPHSFNLLLTHHLDSLLKLHHFGLDLALAGHTHGGQIRVPFWGAIICESKLPRRFIEGLNEYKGIHTFVSRGIGSGRIIPLRFFCPPEAIMIEIKP